MHVRDDDVFDLFQVCFLETGTHCPGIHHAHVIDEKPAGSALKSPPARLVHRQFGAVTSENLNDHPAPSASSVESPQRRAPAQLFSQLPHFLARGFWTILIELL